MNTGNIIKIGVLLFAGILRVSAQTETFPSTLTKNDVFDSPAASTSEIQKIHLAPVLNVENILTTQLTDGFSSRQIPGTKSLLMPVTYNKPTFDLQDDTRLYVSGFQDNIQGIMSFSAGSVSLRQNIGRVNISASLLAEKTWMPMHGGLYSRYGVGGSASFRLGDNITAYAFGSYYPSMSGSYGVGGYMDIRFSEHWGAEIGGYMEYNSFIHQRSYNPIVTPYYRFNDGTKLHIPIGPFVREGFIQLGKLLNGH